MPRYYFALSDGDLSLADDEVGEEFDRVEAAREHAMAVARELSRHQHPWACDAYHTHPHLRNLVDRYQSILLVQAQQNGACHALHSVRSRFCRWLLQSQDMIGSDTFTLTQEFLSHMLGVRRNTVSVEAHAVQEAGLIRYRRGNITILNRDGLEDCACECYSVIREETDKLMGPAKTPSEPGA
jgi:CRP-like cAMP-binding protein